MRKGILPLWEDKRNENGGTYTIKIDHQYGYEIWSMFVMYMVGETLTYDMQNINGITVSYISNTHNFNNPLTKNTSSTYIKIWDGKAGRTLEQFSNILPLDLFNKIKMGTLMYAPNKSKKDFNEKNIVNKLNGGDYKKNKKYY
jgi:hypothetical protein